MPLAAENRVTFFPLFFLKRPQKAGMEIETWKIDMGETHLTNLGVKEANLKGQRKTHAFCLLTAFGARREEYYYLQPVTLLGMLYED